MSDPEDEKNTYHKAINSVPGREIGHMIFPNHVVSWSNRIDKTAKAAACANLQESVNSQATGLLEEWQKLLLHSVNVNVYGNDIPGILTQMQTDHITIVGESQIYVIPTQHVAFICYNIK